MAAADRKIQRSLLEFQKLFPDDTACAEFLFVRRSPKGFVCPSCGSVKAVLLRSRFHTYECLECGRQTSVTAGTIMHRSKLPLRTWFWAAHLMATHSNGISALQLKGQLKIRYPAAWLLAHKLRRSMVDPDRESLNGVVEVDQTEVPYRTHDSHFDPVKSGKILIIGAVEVVDRTTNKPRVLPYGGKYLNTRSRRVRLAAIPDNKAEALQAFIRANIAPGATLLTDGHRSYTALAEYRHDPRTVGRMAGHVVLPWIHKVFALLKRWGMRTFHGLRRKHIDRYLAEFAFRYNRRHFRRVSFETMLGLASGHGPITYWEIIKRENPRAGEDVLRKSPRRRRTAFGWRSDKVRSRPIQRVPTKAK
jgi:predicted RNA-binding Zn-ribbon protein involved in translation (DUF1610 family)/transposase-like protein